MSATSSTNGAKSINEIETTSASASGQDVEGVVPPRFERMQIQPGTFMTRDEQELAFLGKRQQLERNFGFMSIVGLACTIMITWEGYFSVFTYNLVDGGPAGMVYGFLFVWFGYMAVCASMAELTSMYPTAGGMYHWTFLLAPPNCRKFLSYITGWQSVIAWQAVLASAAYLGGTMIQGLIVLNHPEYVFQRWHGTLLLYLVMALALFINTCLAKTLPKIEAVVLFIHIIGFICVIIPLTYLGPHGSAEDVFGKFLSLGGYNDMGLAWFVGLLTPIFAFVGADGAIHMCEEIEDASIVVPWTLVASIALNGILGFAMLLAVLFCMGDISAAINTPTGFPYLEVFYQAVNSVGGATAMAVPVVSLMIFACIAILASASRMTWAFARDKGLPGAKLLAKVDTYFKLPLMSLLITSLITLLLGLINIGSAEAINAVGSLCVAGYLGSYILPIALILYHRITRPEAIVWGRWALGKWGITINAISLVWIIIVLFFSFFPTVVPFTPKTMNWNVVLWGGTNTLGFFFYILHQKKYYKGPVVEDNLQQFMRERQV